MNKLSLLISLLVSGCGTISGGADYRVNVITSDGTQIEAQATVASESESVEAVFERDSQGIKSVKFRKIGTRQAEQNMLNIMEKQTELLNSLVNRRQLP